MFCLGVCRMHCWPWHWFCLLTFRTFCCCWWTHLVVCRCSEFRESLRRKFRIQKSHQVKIAAPLFDLCLLTYELFSALPTNSPTHVTQRTSPAVSRLVVYKMKGKVHDDDWNENRTIEATVKCQSCFEFLTQASVTKKQADSFMSSANRVTLAKACSGQLVWNCGELWWVSQ